MNSDTIFLLVVIIAWFALNFFILPAMGVPT